MKVHYEPEIFEQVNNSITDANVAGRKINHIFLEGADVNLFWAECPGNPFVRTHFSGPEKPYKYITYRGVEIRWQA